MEDGAGVLALLGDGFLVRVHVSPAGCRSPLAEIATRSLMDNRGNSAEMTVGGSGVYGHERGGERNVFHAEMDSSGLRGPLAIGSLGVNRGASMDQMGGSRGTKETWEEREMCPVRDTDCGSGICPGKAVTSTSYRALNYARGRPIASRMRGIPVSYVSSYQRDHCQFRPVSPCLPADEFPRRLSRPDLMTGNFVIGENASKHGCGSGSHHRSHYVRTSDDYGWFYNRPPSVSPDRCWTDESAFVSSLRRYPNAPERSKSVDLLQSIAYMQQNVKNRNLQVKTLRYLREKAREVETELKGLQAKLSKKKTNEEPTRQTAGPSRENTPKYRDTKSSFLREHTAIFKHKNKLTMKRSLSFENYNYLKPSRPDCAKSMANKRMDIRYLTLTDISRELKKFIDGNDESVQMTLCSKLSKRYMDHCRLHHKKSADQGTLCVGTDRDGTQDNSGASRSPRNSRPSKICCYCRKPVPCGCKKKRMTREEFIMQKINEWLQDIPIYPNETFLEKALRDDLIKKLKSSLARLPPGEDFLDAAEKYVEQCVEKLPMWHPDSKGEQELLQKQVAKNLLQKLEGVSAFAIDKEIIDAFDNVKFKLKDSNSMLVNRYDLMKNVTDQLRDLIQNKPSDDKAYRGRLRSKVADILAELPIETRPGKKRETLEKLADEITEKLMIVQTKPGGASSGLDFTDDGTKPQEFFDQRAENILKSIPGIENMSESERNMIRQEISKKLQEVQRLSNVTEVRDAMLNIIANALKRTGVTIGEQEQKKLAERLTGQVTTSSNRGTEDNMLWKKDDTTLFSSRGTENIKKVLRGEVTDILNETSVPLDKNIKKEVESLLADQIMRGKTVEQALTEISRFLNGPGLPMDEAESIARTLTRNIDNKLDMSFEESSHEDVVNEILNFIDQFSDSRAGSDAARTKKKKMAKELGKIIQNIKVDQTMSNKDKETKIREETATMLQKMNLKTDISVKQMASKLAKKLSTGTARSSTPISGDKKLNASVSSSDIALSPITSDTLFIPKRGKAPKPSKKSADHLDQAIRDWCAQKRINISEDNVKKLASEFVEWSRLFDENAEYDTLDEEGSQKTHLRQWLEVNTDLAKRDDFPSLVDSLLERLRSIPLPSASSASARIKRGDISTGPENAAELSDWVARWCDKLTVVASTSPQDQAKLKSLKQNLTSKLMLKIGALNLNPETLNDDFLYESMLSDEIDQLFEEFPQSCELANSKAELKKELMDLVITAKQNIKEKLAGNSYKQQIKVAIKNLLPCICKLADIQVQFEGLRNNIADAFINIVTAVNNQKREEATSKYNEEANKYITMYTKDTGGRSNVAELNKKLIRELQNIQKPSTAALNLQLEEISVRDEVKSWIRQLPLQNNLMANQEVQMHKIISVLGLRVRDLEKQNQSKPDPNYDKKLQSEITKWLSKLPLQENVSFQTLSPLFAESFKNRDRPDVNSIPSSALSAADRTHMDRIRDRGGHDEDWVANSETDRSCMANITEGSCQTSTSYKKPCRSLSRVAGATSPKCCQNSTQTNSCKSSQTPQQCPSRTSANLQTPFHGQGMQDQSQCIRSSGYDQPCSAPRRYNVTTPCLSSALPSSPCNATYDTSGGPYPHYASHGPPCLQSLTPPMKPPSCLMKRTFRDRPRSSVQIKEPTDYGCRDHGASEPKYYKESGTTAEVAPRQNHVQRPGGQHGNWHGCQRPPELSQHTCSDQQGPMRCQKRKDWRRRSILSSNGPCKTCAEPLLECNRRCTRNCPHPSYLYFRH